MPSEHLFSLNNNTDWWLVISGILLIIAGILGEKYVRIKQKIKDVAELLDYLHQALQDNRITNQGNIRC